MSAVLVEEAGSPASPVRAYVGIELAAVPSRRSVPGPGELESQVAWLEAQLSGDPASCFDVRWLNDPDSQRLRLVVLAAVDGPDVPSTRYRAEKVAERLGVVPPYVRATRIDDRAVLEAALRPFTPDRRGMVEVRKQCFVGHPNRPDAGVRSYFAIRPFTVAPFPWTTMLAAMATHPAPLVLSVGLMPTAVSTTFSRTLEVNAAGYARLAREGEWRASGSLYLPTVKLAPEPFAVEAEQLFLDAWRRYRDRIFRIRVQLCSPEPIDDGLANLVGTTISPARASNGGPGGITGGSTHVLERPTSTQDQSRFVGNLESLTHHDWGGDPDVWGRTPDQRLPAALRDLWFAADTSEAGAAVQLPLAPFSCGSTIFVNYRRKDSSGYVNGLYDRLYAHFGPNRVIRDLESIPAGDEFVRFITEAVASCGVLIVVIGKTWVTCQDTKGRRRLDNPDDHVRLEIALALGKGIPVLPVLVDGAPIPPPEELPADLAPLSGKNALEISDVRWDFDVRRLIKSLEKILADEAL